MKFLLICKFIANLVYDNRTPNICNLFCADSPNIPRLWIRGVSRTCYIWWYADYSTNRPKAIITDSANPEYHFRSAFDDVSFVELHSRIFEALYLTIAETIEDIL